MHNSSQPDTPIEMVNYFLEEAITSLNQNKIDNSKNFLMRAYSIINGIDQYTSENSTEESKQLKKLAELTKNIDWNELYQKGLTQGLLKSVMLTGHLQTLFLKFMINSISAKRVLEIGMFSGYATLAMAEVLPDEGKIITCEIDSFLVNLATEYFNNTACKNKIIIELNPAIKTLNKLKNNNENPFDFIFIDADKENYTTYYDFILDSGLLAAHGVMCFDNTLMKGSVYAQDFEHPYKNAISNFNMKLKSDLRTNKVILPIRDGITMVRHRH